MPRKSKAFLKRSAAAKLGWQRRRNYERLHKIYKQHYPKKEREITPPPNKVMWRVTVSAPYFHRVGKKRGSISSSYMVRGWYATKREAQEALGELSDTAINGRFDVLENDRKAWWNRGDDEVNTEIRSVPYDERFLDTIEEKDERIL